MTDIKEKQYYSFEEAGDDDIFGDIISEKKTIRPLKIGLLTCGYFEYWRMYPNGLKKYVTEDLERVGNRLEKMYPGQIVYSGMVDTLDSADSAAKKFKAENVDVMIIAEGTYIPDFITLHVINTLGNIPLIFFSVQSGADMDPDSDYEQSLRNSSMIGTAQITGTLRKMKRDYRIGVGSTEDDRAYGKIGQYIAASHAVINLNDSNIGIIGHVFRGMYDLELNKTLLKQKFGVNLINIQSSHLLDEWERTDDAEVKEVSDGLLGKYKSKDITRNDVERAVRLGLAMKALAKKFRLNAMCFLDQHFVQKQTGTTARMGASLMMEESDISVSCEGDIGGLVTMMLMRSISGMPALMCEWGEFDTSSNSVLLMGHGIGTRDMAASDADITLSGTPEMWGFDGNGLNYEYIVKPGKVTVAHIMEIDGNYRMISSELESIPHAKFNYSELHALVRTDEPVKEYLEKLLDKGVSHHCILGLGHFGGILETAADILGIDKFVL
nr:hypothetical protein [Clostridia bacterium]